MQTRKHLTLLLICILSAIFSSTLQAQDAEKQKIIGVIKGEVDAYIKKDKERWASYWIQTNRTKSIFITSRYEAYIGWDSIVAAYKNTWTSSTIYDNVKSDFDISIYGTVAIAHLNEVSQGETGKQMIVLEKSGKTWKILEMYTFGTGLLADTDVAIEANLNTQGYKLLFRKKVDEAIRIFTLNTELYPGSWNTWDSLAEAYMEKGDKPLAIAYYQKSILLNNKNENAKKYLQELMK